MNIHGAFRFGLLGGLGVLTALLIGNAIITLATVITYIGFALFLALGLDPVVHRLEKRGVNRPIAIAIVVLGLIAFFAGFIFALAPVVIEQTNHLYLGVLDFLTTYDSLGELINAIQAFVPSNLLDIQTMLDSVIAFLSDPANIATIGGGIWSVGAGFASAMLGFFVTIMLSIYLIVALPSIKQSVYGLVPASKRQHFVGIAEQVTGAIGNYVTGQALQGLANGVLSLIVLSLLGAKYAALFALVALLFSLLPLVGTLTGSAIIVLMQLLVDPTMPLIALWIAIYYLIYMQVEAYLIGPYIMNKAVKVPGVLVIIAALAGGALLGVMGAIVAIPVAASVLIIIRQVVLPAQNER